MSETTQLTVDRESGKVVLRAPALAPDRPWEVTRELVGRLLATACVESVVLDRSKATATIHLRQESRSSRSPRDGIQEVANSLRHAAPSEGLISDDYSLIDQISLQKINSGTTAATVIHSLPGRVRIRHPLIRHNAEAASRVEGALSTLPGVKSVSLSRRAGTVLVLFDPATTVTSELIAELERSATGRHGQLKLLSGPPPSRWIASGTCLALAVTSEFVLPGLAPVTAGALVGFNLSTMTRGIVELCTLRWRVSALYTVIMGTTLISGQFLAAALMQASITGWHGWSSRRLRKIADRLRNESSLPLVLDRSQQHLLLNGDRFPECLIGTVISLEAQTDVPYDGVVVSGSAELDEHCVRGTADVVRRTVGDHVFAGSRVLTGDLEVRITAVDKQTRISKVRQTLLESLAELPGSGSPTQRSHASASRFVPWTFATGTAAMMVGDLTMLAAVLRPDYATGPSVSERFGTLSSISHLWDSGWLVKNPEILHELAQTETVVVVRPNESTEKKADERSPSESDSQKQSDSDPTQKRTLSFGPRNLDVYEVNSGELDVVEYVRQLRLSHRRVAVVASNSVLEQLIDDDVIRISSTPQDGAWDKTSDLISMHSDSPPVEDLWRVLQETRRPHQQGWAAVVACNALAVSGAFLVGLTSLHVVLITNLGALAAGALYDRHLKRSSLMLSSTPGSTAGNDEMPMEATRDANGDVVIFPARSRKNVIPEADSVSLQEAWMARTRDRNSSASRPWQPKKNSDRVVDLSVSTSAGSL